VLVCRACLSCLFVVLVCRTCLSYLFVVLVCRDSATEITAVIPLFPYARQDRKAEGRVPITAALIMNLLEASGVTRIITMDLHCGQLQGMTARPVDNIFGNIEFVKCVRRQVQELGLTMEDVAIIAPDGGGVPRAKQLKEGTRACGLAFIVKQRAGAGVVEQMDLIGDVQGKVCFVVDDLLDTGGTLCMAAQVLKDNGGTHIYGCITHGLFCGKALENINNSQFERLFVTNTLFQGENQRQCAKIEVIDISQLMADVIERAHSSSSISELFTYCV
jgi:ribose-phosphate pyrophosphokinase